MVNAAVAVSAEIVAPLLDTVAVAKVDGATVIASDADVTGVDAVIEAAFCADGTVAEMIGAVTCTVANSGDALLGVREAAAPAFDVMTTELGADNRRSETNGVMTCTVATDPTNAGWKGAAMARTVDDAVLSTRRLIALAEAFERLAKIEEGADPGEELAVCTSATSGSDSPTVNNVWDDPGLTIAML